MNVKPASLGKEGLALFCVAASACGVLELMIVSLLRSYHFAPAASIYLAVILWQLVWLRYTRHNRQFAMFLLIMTTIAGPFGCGICLLAAIIYGCVVSNAVLPDEWIRSYFFYEEKEASEKIHERITFGLDNLKPAHDIEPLQDILETGTVLQKQMVIAKITRYFCPQFSPFLLQAIQDENPAVRVQAATAMAKIERDFMTQYIALEDALENNPGDYETRLRLAQLYDSYAHAGLIDEESRKSCREKAISIYENCLKEQGNSQLRHLLARLYVRHGFYGKAEAILYPEIESGAIPFTGMLWYMEALFHLKKFKPLRQVAGQYIPMLSGAGNPMFQKEMENVLCTWNS